MNDDDLIKKLREYVDPGDTNEDRAQIRELMCMAADRIRDPGPPPDYRKERHLEQITFMASVIASGIAGREGTATSIANRAIEIADAIFVKVSQR